VYADSRRIELPTFSSVSDCQLDDWMSLGKLQADCLCIKIRNTGIEWWPWFNGLWYYRI